MLLICFLGLAGLTGSGCSESPIPSAPVEPRWSDKYLIGTYYYLWYPGNWREGYINGRLFPQQLPVLGQYDSSDLRTIERHISWSFQFGIDFWAISWWPGQPELDRVIRDRIFQAKNIGDIKFCIFYESGGLGLEEDRIELTPQKAQKLLTDFKYLARNYFTHPSYLKIKERPVVILYLTRTFVGDYEKVITGLRKELQSLGFDLFLVGDEIFWYVMRPKPLPPSTTPFKERMGLFDAVTSYNLYNWAKPKQMGYGISSTYLSEVHDLFVAYRSAGGQKVRLIPSAIPGYNDRGVRLSEKHPVIPRQFDSGGEEGSFFVQALKKTVVPFIDPVLPMVLITSFNEWNEGTQVEPAREEGETREDHSPSRKDYTQGYLYRGYGERYLSIIRDVFCAVGGRVVDSQNGKGLARVIVKVYKNEKLMAESRTDSQGYFNLSRLNLPWSSYVVKAELTGFLPSQSEIQIKEDKTALLTIRLQKE